jgi:glutamine amidotransferase
VSPDVLLIDYGVGNLGSLLRAFERIDTAAELTSNPDLIRQGRRLVLPGVGHFGESMSNLRERGLEEPLRSAVDRGAWLLGICVGFQMLFEFSEEAPGVEGLGLLSGHVERFTSDLTVPHIGWNQLEDKKDAPLLDSITNGDYFYFLHSYFVKPGHEDIILAETEYGLRFCSVSGNDRIMGIQFHPEKSQHLGLRVLRNFCYLS